MNELEKLTLRRIMAITREGEKLLTETAIKAHGGKEPIVPEKDIYPTSGKMTEIYQLAEAILNNK